MRNPLSLRAYENGVSAVFIIVIAFTFAVVSESQSASIKLNDEGQSFSDVFDFVISPDGQLVVYLHNPSAANEREVFVVPISGGTPVQLSEVHPGAGTDIVLITPTGARVVYDQYTAGGYVLRSVPIAGPMGAGSDITMPFAGGILWLGVSPDGSRAIYETQQSGVIELYSTPVLGPAGAEVRLHGAVPALMHGVVDQSVVISPDSSRVVYAAELEDRGFYDLYSVPVAGPAAAAVKLNLSLAGEMVQPPCAISPTSDRVVYMAVAASGEWGLHSVPIGGPASAGVKLNLPLQQFGSIGTFRISPDGNRVVYKAQQDTQDVYELYSVPIVGPASSGVKLNRSMVGGGQVAGGIAISPDGGRVVYVADQETNDVFELFSVPLLGPATSGVKLNGGLVTGGDVNDFAISPDSRWVVYRADQQIDGEAFGYRAPLAGPEGRDEGIWSVPDTSISGGSNSYRIDPASQQVVMRGGWAFLDDIIRLWYCILAGTPEFGGKILNDPLVAGGMVPQFDISSDGRYAVYRADQDVDDKTELYAVILPILFRDGFEFGDASAWSSTKP